MSRYRKGRRFEYYIKQLYENNGWVVIRCAGSKPVDLIAFKHGLVHIIECKTETPTNRDREHLRGLSKQIGRPIILCYKKGKQVIGEIVEERGLSGLGIYAESDTSFFGGKHEWIQFLY